MLTIRRRVYDAIIEHGRDGGRNEVCGILAGSYDDPSSRVVACEPIDNVSTTPRQRYEMDPEALLREIEAIEDRGLDVVGFYHTHPAGPPYPSAVDAEQATWTDYSYVICAFDGHPFVGSWRWRDGEFEPETLTLTTK